jgi:hypothetical protein
MNTNKKLIAAIAAGVIGASGFAQTANAVTGNAQAVLVAPISITESTALNFGSIANSVSAGTSTFVINNDGSAPTVGANLAQVGTAATRGIFAVSGTGSLAYTVTIPAGSITLTESGGAGHTMSVGTFTSRTASTGAGTAGTLSSGSDTVYIGATLTVGTAAVNEAGTYNGTYTVTVAYN